MRGASHAFFVSAWADSQSVHGAVIFVIALRRSVRYCGNEFSKFESITFFLAIRHRRFLI